MKTMTLTVAILVLVATVPATMQDPPKNPTTAVWTCPDHDQDSEHELKIIRVTTSGRTEIATILLGDPPYSDAATKTVTATINVQPIAFGEYVATMTAVALVNGVPIRSDVSVDSNRFQRVPGAPGKLAIQ